MIRMNSSFLESEKCSIERKNSRDKTEQFLNRLPADILP